MTFSVTDIEAETARWARRRAALLPYWPWTILGLAAFIFAVRFIPQFFFSEMDTETIVLPLFYHDIAELHHPVSNWGWGGFSALFPDTAVFFVLNFICRDGQLALQVLQIVFWLGWLAATIALALVFNLPNKLSLISILVLVWVGLICNFALPDEWALDVQKALLQPVYHSGTGLLCLICLVLLLREISLGRTAGFWWLFVLTFLGGISDILFLIVFVCPSLATVGLLAAAYPRAWKIYRDLALNLGLAGMAAYVLAPYCFAAPLATESYVQASLGGARGSLASLSDEMKNSQHHLFVFMVVLDVLTMLGGLAGLLFFCFSPRRKLVTPAGFSLVVFCTCAVFLNWLAVIFTGDYQGMPANRYLAVALLIPIFLLAFGLHAIIFWRPWLEKLFAVAIAAFTAVVAFIPQAPSLNYWITEQDIPFLKAEMKKNHIQDCLANYWSANIVTFLSHGDVPTRSLTNDGRIYRWFNTLSWFGKGSPVRDWPNFRLIYIPDHEYSNVFGQPDEIVYTPSHSEIWLYSEARSIRYSEFFDVLSNSLLDEGRTLRIDASALPSEVGKIQGRSRIVTMGQDSAGWLDYGPYLNLAPGRYRTTFDYACLTLPVADAPPTYDLLVHTGTHEQSFRSAVIPCSKIGPQSFTDDFIVDRPEHQYEMRIYYHGSGTLRIDSLKVTYLGP
jgi:hypothetical protein